ncbi:MAG: DUF6293 family protein [Promethearchaeota archaeon]
MSSTQIIFIGHHKPRLIDSLRQYPINKIILVVGEKETSGEVKSRKIAKEMRDELGSIWFVELVKVDQIDILTATKQIIRLINNEKEMEQDVLLNASGSLRGFAIAAYIAACLTQTKIVTAIPKYNDQGEEVGLEKMIEVPILPLGLPGLEQMYLLLNIGNGVNSVEELVMRLNNEINKDSADFRRERSRISHLLSKLEQEGFITRLKSGKTVRTNLTWIGEIYTELPNIQFRIPNDKFLNYSIKDVKKFFKEKYNLKIILTLHFLWQGKILETENITLRELGVKVGDEISVMNSRSL